MFYNPPAIASYFDKYGNSEWHRLLRTPTDEVSLHIHTHYLRENIPPGIRVLDIGAGPGRFTQILNDIGCRIVVADISPVQLELNRKFAEELGFLSGIEKWIEADICALHMFADGEFDAVLAYGGPLSYALDNREQAARECRRVVKEGGVVLVSVLSLWGSVHSGLPYVFNHPSKLNRQIIATGDLNSETQPFDGHHAHLYRSAELRDLLEAHGLHVHQMSASSVLSAVHEEPMTAVRADPDRWAELLSMELEACAYPGCIDAGSHMIAVARRER